MLNLRVTFTGLGALTQQLSTVQQQVLPEAIALTVNRLGLQFQRDERDRIERVFTLRRGEFIKREAVKRLGPAATAQSPTVTFGISDRADFLRRFEPGEAKRPREGRSLAIPREVRRTKSDLITRINRPRQLIQRNKQSGARGVFAIQKPGGPLKPGIYQRAGTKGRKGLTLLYRFVDQVPTEPLLQYQRTAERTAGRVEEFFDQAWSQVLRRRGITA